MIFLFPLATGAGTFCPVKRCPGKPAGEYERKPNVAPSMNYRTRHIPQTPFTLEQLCTSKGGRWMFQILRVIGEISTNSPWFLAQGGPGGECAERERDEASRCDCVMNPQAVFGLLFDRFILRSIYYGERAKK